MDRSKNYIFLLPQINRIFFKDLWAELSRYNQINKLWTLKQKSVKTKAHNDSQNVMFTLNFSEKKDGCNIQRYLFCVFTTIYFLGPLFRQDLSLVKFKWSVTQVGTKDFQSLILTFFPCQGQAGPHSHAPCYHFQTTLATHKICLIIRK